jgi:hypothetical protein
MGNGHMDQGSARRAEAHRESGNRDSRGHKHHVIESAEFATSEIPMGSEPLDQTLIGGLLLSLTH